MKLSRSLRNRKRVGDLFVRQTPHEQLKNLSLASGHRMTRKKLCVEQRFGQNGICRQDLGRHPKLPFQDAMDRERQFRLPCLAQFHEAFDAPKEKSDLLRKVAGCRRKKREKFAAR